MVHMQDPLSVVKHTQALGHDRLLRKSFSLKSQRVSSPASVAADVELVPRESNKDHGGSVVAAVLRRCNVLLAGVVVCDRHFLTTMDHRIGADPRE